jgi:hypothetical protein
MSTSLYSNGQLANGTRGSWISTAAFNNDFFSYTTSVSSTTFQTTGSLGAVVGATSGTCPAGRVLRENGKKLYPVAHNGVSTYMIGVFDPVSFLSGFIDPNSTIFAIYNTNKPASLDTTLLAGGVNPNGGAIDLAPPIYTAGTVTAVGNITSVAGNISATVGSVSAGTTVTAGTGISTALGDIVATTGSVLAGSTFGLKTGAGGTVTQGTDKSTGVTLSKSTGQITMNNAQLNAGFAVSFVVTNTLCDANDFVALQVIGGVSSVFNYRVVAQPGAESFTVNVQNVTGVNLSEAIVIQYVLIKAVTA